MCWIYFSFGIILQIVLCTIPIFFTDVVKDLDEVIVTYIFYGWIILLGTHAGALSTDCIESLVIAGIISSSIYALASVYFFAKGTIGYIWAALCLINGVIPCFWLYGIFALWLSATIFMFIMGIGTWVEMKRLKRILGLAKRKARTDLDYLASEASLSKREVERLLMRLLNSGRLTGILDRETGKFTYIPRHKIEAVFRLIESRGVVSLRELASKFNLTERELELLITSMRRS